MVMGGCMSWNNEHNLDDANSIIEEAMISAGQPIYPNTQSHLLIIVFDSLVRMGKVETAKKAADMAFAADRKIENPYTRGWRLVATTKALVQCGNTEAAKKAAAMRHSPLRSRRRSLALSLLF
jgi:hypothetical protein